MDVKRFTTADGRRAEERISETNLDNGVIEQVVESHEEAIPLRIVKKVTKKMSTVPVDEKVEIFGDDGSVQTSIRTVSNEAFQLRDPQQCVTLSDLMNKVNELTEKLSPTRTVKATAHVSPAKIKAQLQAHFDNADPVVVTDEPSPGEKWAGLVGWGLAAAAAALAVFTMTH